MLGRLRMPVDQAILAYREFEDEVYSRTKWLWSKGTYRAVAFEKAVKRIVGRYSVPSANQATLPRTPERDERDERIGADIRMHIKQHDGRQCCVFVCSYTAETLSSSTRFRTYPSRVNDTTDCYIWEAARATSAEPKFFKPALIREDGLMMHYVGGGLRCNNPTDELLHEAAQHLPGRRVACILSIGTGQQAPIRLPSVGPIPKLQLMGVVEALEKISHDCEAVHAGHQKRFDGWPGTYFRLNVVQGLQKVGFAELKNQQSVKAQTKTYLEHRDTVASIDNAVRAIRERGREGMMTVEQAADQG
ncbi:hypothetical protein FRC07_005927 [Ceratobasidium sp. 392]|nr:hypothetical protein FRC07_005927 [Ceratobasidium sp. 392]